MGQMHEKTVEAFKRQPLKGKYKNRKSNDSSTSEQLSTSNRQKIWNMHLTKTSNCISRCKLKFHGALVGLGRQTTYASKYMEI